MMTAFITFEGGEGAGKSSLLSFLEKQLTHAGFSVVRTREPGGSVLSDQLRKILLETQDPLDPMAELLLLLAARAQHLSTLIRPALLAGKIVLCDRFNDSTIAYQGKARGIGVEKVQSLCEVVCQNTLPDLTFYLDVPPEIGLKRTEKLSKENAKAGMKDRIEAEAITFHETVREAFLEIAKQNKSRVKVLDAIKPIDEVEKAALKIVLDYLHHDK